MPDLRAPFPYFGGKSRVAVLFARRDSVYKSLPGTDVWDIERDARKWPGGCPVVAHPPCRAWGRLRHFAHPRPDEMELAVLAVEAVRKWGGVLEHPAGSKLWAERLPYPGNFDKFGGWTLPILQQWYGHRAEKGTWLYIVGVTPEGIPEIPLVLGEASHVINSSLRAGRRPEVSKAEREHTPPALASWLCEVARRAGNSLFTVGQS